MNDSDFLGIAAFVSAVGNIVQAADRKQLQTLYDNLLVRYREVYAEYQNLSRTNQQLQQQVVQLRILNDRLQKQMTAARRVKRVRRAPVNT
jgi:hypothetical protein